MADTREARIDQSFSFLFRYNSVGGYTVVQLLTSPEIPRQQPYNCVLHGTHRASFLWDEGDEAVVIRSEYLSMNVRNVLVVSLVFVPCNDKREEVALAIGIGIGKAGTGMEIAGVKRWIRSFPGVFDSWKQARQRAFEEIHSPIESRSSRTRSSSSLSAEKSVAFLVPNLGMSLTLRGLTLLSS